MVTNPIAETSVSCGSDVPGRNKRNNTAALGSRPVPEMAENCVVMFWFAVPTAPTSTDMVVGVGNTLEGFAIEYSRLNFALPEVVFKVWFTMNGMRSVPFS